MFAERKFVEKTVPESWWFVIDNFLFRLALVGNSDIHHTLNKSRSDQRMDPCTEECNGWKQWMRHAEMFSAQNRVRNMSRPPLLTRQCQAQRQELLMANNLVKPTLILFETMLWANGRYIEGQTQDKLCMLTDCEWAKKGRHFSTDRNTHDHK